MKQRSKISNLKEGDLFEHKSIIYEVVSKGKWNTEVKYVDDSNNRYAGYLYCNFSNYTIVNI